MVDQLRRGQGRGVDAHLVRARIHGGGRVVLIGSRNSRGAARKSQYAAAVPIFIDRAVKHEPITIFGDGEQTRDFIYVKDIVAANAVGERFVMLLSVSSTLYVAMLVGLLLGRFIASQEVDILEGEHLLNPRPEADSGGSPSVHPPRGRPPGEAELVRPGQALDLGLAAKGGGAVRLPLAPPQPDRPPRPCILRRDAAVVLADVKKGKGTYGYNAATGEYGDMLDMGILDPTKVTRTALQNAASIASLLLTTEALIVEKKEDKPAPAAPGGGGMGGMY